MGRVAVEIKGIWPHNLHVPRSPTGLRSWAPAYRVVFFLPSYRRLLMKFCAAFALWQDLYLSLCAGLPSLLRALWADKWLIFHPTLMSQIYFTSFWTLASGSTDEGGRETKELIITPNAQGVVLDIGAGFGHTAKYLDRSKVELYVALEPNALMHTRIREEAYRNKFYEDDGSLIILPYGAEESTKIISSLPRNTPVDTIVSVLSLCSIPSPEQSISRLVHDVLKPGGHFLFYEHVLSRRADVAWWQRLWTPIWSIGIGGCRLDVPSDRYVRFLTDYDEGGREINMWSEGTTMPKQGEDEENLWWHQAGKFVKHL